MEMRLFNFKSKPMKLISVLLLAISVSVFAQSGKQFPEMKVSNLDGKEMTFPAAIKGKETVICLVYSPKTEKALETWLQPMWTTFQNKSPLNPVQYDVNMYFVMMLSGLKDAASDIITKKLKKNLDPQLQPFIVLYQGSLKPYLSELDFGKKDEPYFCIIDKNGKILHSVVGFYTDEKMEELESKLEAK